MNSVYIGLLSLTFTVFLHKHYVNHQNVILLEYVTRRLVQMKPSRGFCSASSGENAFNLNNHYNCFFFNDRKKDGKPVFCSIRLQILL
jgi:hypothetical protein